jgi:hypothetical protein
METDCPTSRRPGQGAGLASEKFETGSQSLLEFLRKSEECVETRRRLGFSIPEVRPLLEPAVGELRLRISRSAAFAERFEQAGSEKAEGKTRRKIPTYQALLDLKIAEPFPDAELSCIEEMSRRLVQRLEKCRVQSERTARLEHAKDFPRGARRIAQMLENIEGKDPIETAVAKRQRVGITDHVGVAKDFVLQLNASRILPLGRAGTEMQDALVTPRKNFFELEAHRVAGMRGWYGGNLCRVGQEDRDPIDDRKSSTTICTAKQVRCSYEFAPANRAGEERREVRIHAACETGFDSPTFQLSTHWCDHTMRLRHALLVPKMKVAPLTSHRWYSTLARPPRDGIGCGRRNRMIFWKKSPLMPKAIPSGSGAHKTDGYANQAVAVALRRHPRA